MLPLRSGNHVTCDHKHECGYRCYHAQDHEPDPILECKSRLCPNLRRNGRRTRVKCVEARSEYSKEVKG